jgi:hypothetical protein
MTAALLALGYGCTRSRPAKEGAAPTVVRTTEAVKIGSPDAIPAAARGMWVWSTKSRLDDPNGTAKLLDTCRIAGLNEVYLSVNNGVLDDPRLVTLMTALRAAGVRVEALMGDAVWYQPDKRAPMLALVEAVAAYDEKHEAARFAGVHLDIEPHQLPANRGDHSFLPALAETIKEATELATRKNLSASADLPRFALDEAGPELARTGARPFVMLYQLREKTPAWLVTQSGKVIDHSYAGVGNEVPGGVVVGLRVEDYPTDLESMLTALQGAHGDRSRYRGWAIHDEAKYRARPRP